MGRPSLYSLDADMNIGTTAHFLRIFPHTMITLVANEVSPRSAPLRNPLTCFVIGHHQRVSEI
jgi:hypothetical protein